MIPLVLFDTSHSVFLMIALQMSGVGAILLSQKIPEISLDFVLVLQLIASPYIEDNVVCVPP